MARANQTVKLDGRQIGQAAHLVLGELLEAGQLAPSQEDLFAAVAASELVTKRVATYRQVAKQRLLTAISLYYRHFLPDGRWRFFARELAVEGGRLDLVWRSAGRRILADELKTGWPRDPEERGNLESQLERQLAGAGKRFGSSFAGIRILLLGAPARSFLLRPDGERIDLEEADA